MTAAPRRARSAEDPEAGPAGREAVTLITDTDALAAFCARQAGTEFIAVDTEFMRERTYWPILCLVQVAGPDEAAAIDTLAPGIDLAPLLALMVEPQVLKVFHAARQDLEIFFQLSGEPEIMMLLRPVEIDLTGSHSLESTLHAECADVNMSENHRDEEYSDDGVYDLRDLHPEDVRDVERE